MTKPTARGGSLEIRKDFYRILLLCYYADQVEMTAPISAGCD